MLILIVFNCKDCEMKTKKETPTINYLVRVKSRKKNVVCFVKQ